MRALKIPLHKYLFSFKKKKSLFIKKNYVPATSKEIICINYAASCFKEGLKKGEQLLLKFETPEFKTSEIKLFSKLWEDYGLQDYGANFMKEQFSDDEKRSCIRYWVKVLYGRELNMRNFLDEISRELMEYRIEWRKTHDGCIDMASPLNVMPNRIDKLYGMYES